MRPLRLAPLALVVLALLSCSGRDRTNPLDPGNPETSGRPVGFVAVAGNEKVDLRWSGVDVPGLAGYWIERRAEGETGFTPLLSQPVGPEVVSFVDTNVGNDSTYEYRLSFVLDSGARSFPAPSMARPGPGAAWIADAGTDRLVRLSPDGRTHTFIVAAPDEPGWVRVDPEDGRAWATSRTLGVVAVWAPTSSLIGASSGLGAPGAVAPIPASFEAWIAEERFGEVSRWSPSGGITARSDEFGLPSDVIALADGGAWVADRTRRTLVRLRADASEATSVSLEQRPWRLAEDPFDGAVWIAYTEAGIVERRDSDGSLQERVSGLPAPFSLAFDFGRQWVWVALADGDAVIALDNQGTEVRRIGGIPEPRGLAVDDRLGEVWVTALGEGDEDGAVFHYTIDGALISVYDGVVRPVSVDFDPFVPVFRPLP